MAGYIGSHEDTRREAQADIPDCLDIAVARKPSGVLRVVPYAIGYEHHTLAHHGTICNLASLDRKPNPGVTR